MNLASRLLIAAAFIATITTIAGLAPSARAAEPAVEVTRLMMSGGASGSLRFYDQSARLMISDVGLVFRPDGEHAMVAEVQRADSGEVVATVNFFPGYQWSNAVFADVRPQGPGVVDLPGAGDYRLVFKVNDRTATAFPFTVVAEKSGDPFNPSTRYYYRGQWNELAYLRESTTHTDRPIEVTFWTCALDLPSPDGDGELFVKLIKNEAVLARNKRALRVNKRSNLYGQYRVTLHEPVDNPNAAGFAFDRLLGDDDDYSLVIEIDGAAARAYPVAVRGGAIAVSPRSELGYEPADAYLAPRWIERDDRNKQAYAPETIYWLEAAE